MLSILSRPIAGCSGLAAQTKNETGMGVPSELQRSNEMLRLVRVQLWKAENRIPVDGTRSARHRCVVSRLVDVAIVRFVSEGMSTPKSRRNIVPLYLVRFDNRQ